MVEQILKPEQKIDIFRKEGALYNSYTYPGQNLNKEEFLVSIAAPILIKRNSIEPFPEYTLRHEAIKYVNYENLHEAGVVGHLKRIMHLTSRTLSGKKSLVNQDDINLSQKTTKMCMICFDEVPECNFTKLRKCGHEIMTECL